ncbi:MAG: PilZ domain-containing protein [Novosphingobium sp.]
MARVAAPCEDASVGRRRHSRLRVHLAARLITLEGTLPATLTDLSFRGGKIVLRTAILRRGASAVLSWGSFEAFCTVAWTHGEICGLDFETPLKPQVLIATRDLADANPRVDTNRVAAKAWVTGGYRL